MDIKDLAGLSEPLTKLVEVLGSGMGALYKPIGIRREANAQADAIRLLGKAQQEVDASRMQAIAAAEVRNKLLMTEANLQIEERAQIRLEHREVRRQGNLEAIAEAAVTHLPEQVSNEKVDEDWKTRFFNIAEDVASSEMQDLWGRILAGEVARPGSYSLRTLEVLRNLSKSEAEAFQKIRYLADDGGRVIKATESSKLDDFGIDFNKILKLREAGLLVDGDMLSTELTIPEDKDFIAIGYNGKALMIKPNEKTVKKLSLKVYMYTGAGTELMSLIDPQPNVEYLKMLAVSYKNIASFYLGMNGNTIESFVKL